MAGKQCRINRTPNSAMQTPQRDRFSRYSRQNLGRTHLMLIHNFGLFWRRNDVFWGRPKVRGHLKGVPAKEPSASPADFRDQAGVYVLYDDNFRLVYIGQAGAGNQYLFSRLKHHKKDALADRWTRFS